MHKEKSEDCQLKNDKQPLIPLPSSFPWFQEQNRNQTLKSSPEPWQALSQHILGRLERASTNAAAGTGDNTWQKRALGSKGGFGHGGLDGALGSEVEWWLPHQPTWCSLRERAQRAPAVPWVAPMPSALLFPAPSLPHHSLLEAAVHTPPVPGLALRPQQSRLQFPELLSRARMSRKSGFLDTGLMLEERSARQNWCGLKIA